MLKPAASSLCCDEHSSEVQSESFDSNEKFEETLKTSPFISDVKRKLTSRDLDTEPGLSDTIREEIRILIFRRGSRNRDLQKAALIMSFTKSLVGSRQRCFASLDALAYLAETAEFKLYWQHFWSCHTHQELELICQENRALVIREDHVALVPAWRFFNRYRS